jgi:hypothetical protein
VLPSLVDEFAARRAQLRNNSLIHSISRDSRKSLQNLTISSADYGHCWGRVVCYTFYQLFFPVVCGIMKGAASKPLTAVLFPSSLLQPRVSHCFSGLVKVKATLRLTVSQSVCLGVEPRLGLMTRCFFLLESYCPVHVGRPLWREVGSVICQS